MQNGDSVLFYTDTVDTSGQTFTFPNSQERVRVRNLGTYPITYTVGSQTGSLGPSEVVDVTETISQVTLVSSFKTQAFEIWADELGSNTQGVDLSSITSQLADKAQQATIGDLTQLNTTDKTSVVNALKEVKTQANNNASSISSNALSIAAKADKSYVDTQVASVASGSPKGTYATLSALQTAFPTGNSNIYVVTADGKWYYWNGSAWTAGGTYQATAIGAATVSRSNLTDTFSLNPDLANATDLNTVTKEGLHTGKANAGYLNLPPGWPAANSFILRVDPSYTTSPVGRYYIQRLTDLASPFKTWIRLVDTTGAFTLAWVDPTAILDNSVTTTKILDKNVTRTKLADDFMINYAYIQATGDLNNALTQGNFMVMPGAANSPLPNATFTLKVDVYKTGSASSYWLTQLATTADGVPRSFIRKLFQGQTFSSWIELTNLQSEGFLGKTIVCFGDSITENGDYPARLASKLGANVISQGYGGCRMTTYGAGSDYSTMCMGKLSSYINSGNYTELVNAANDLYTTTGDDNRPQVTALQGIDFNTVDYITIFHGTNDYGGNMPIGNATDTDENTFKGAINMVVNNILSKYPHIKLLFIAPMWRATYTGVSGTVDSDTYTNPLGNLLIDYVNALVERANAHHIPVLDLYRESGINKYNYNYFLVDGLHPKSGVGYEHVAQKITAGFKSKFNV